MYILSCEDSLTVRVDKKSSKKTALWASKRVPRKFWKRPLVSSVCTGMSSLARVYIIGVWGRGGKKSVRRAVIWFCLAKFAVMWMSQSAAPHHFTLWINKKAFAIISRSAKSLGNFLEITHRRDNMWENKVPVWVPWKSLWQCYHANRRGAFLILTSEVSIPRLPQSWTHKEASRLKQYIFYKYL